MADASPGGASSTTRPCYFWLAGEDALLRELVDDSKPQSSDQDRWTAIAEDLGTGRTWTGVREHYYLLTREERDPYKFVVWTPEELDLLSNIVRRLEPKWSNETAWIAIAKELGTGRSWTGVREYYYGITREERMAANAQAAEERAAAKEKAATALAAPRFLAEMQLLLNEVKPPEAVASHALVSCGHLNAAIQLHNTHCTASGCHLRKMWVESPLQRTKHVVAGCVLVHAARESGGNLTFSEVVTGLRTCAPDGGKKYEKNDFSTTFDAVQKTLKGRAERKFACCTIPASVDFETSDAGPSSAPPVSQQQQRQALLERVCRELGWPSDASQMARDLLDVLEVNEGRLPQSIVGAVIHLTRCEIADLPINGAEAFGIRTFDRSEMCKNGWFEQMFGERWREEVDDFWTEVLGTCQRVWEDMRTRVPYQDYAASAHNAGSNGDLQFGWELIEDPASGAGYYYNRFTKERTQTKPAAPQPAPDTTTQRPAKRARINSGRAASSSSSAAASSSSSIVSNKERKWREMRDQLQKRLQLDEAQRADGMPGMTDAELESTRHMLTSLEAKLTNARQAPSDMGSAPPSLPPSGASGGGASAAAAADPNGELRRKDVVELLHRKKTMGFKELKAHFQPFLKSKEDTSAFTQLVRDIAVIKVVGTEMLVSLKDRTKDEFHLEDD